MSSIFSFGANTLIANENTNLNLFFFPFQFIHTKDHEIMQSKLRLMEKVKFSLYQISFKAVHKSSLLLSFHLSYLRQSHLCSFLVQLLIFLLLFSSAIFMSLFLFLKFTSLCFVFPESFLWTLCSCVQMISNCFAINFQASVPKITWINSVFHEPFVVKIVY